MEEEGAEAFFLWEGRRRRRIPSAMREQRTKRAKISSMIEAWG
jgi:hypothetical protein